MIPPPQPFTEWVCKACDDTECHWNVNAYLVNVHPVVCPSNMPGSCNWERCASHSPVPSEQEIRKDEREKTPIICLCGSTRFTREMLIKQWELTKQGYIVVSWCALPDDYYQGIDKAHVGDQEGVKAFVDEIHKRKIDISDEILVIDIGGYIGDSTHSEINYAIKRGKPVRYLSAELRSKQGEQP